MVRLRKFCSYQKIERPYTRISKYKKQSYVKARPHMSIVRFEHGDPRSAFETTLSLVSLKDTQIRHNALESARQTSNRVFEKALGKSGYFLRLRKYPFHILRENAMATGAGADRMSQGMQLSFGKPVSSAAQILVGEILLEVRVDRKNSKLAKLALNRARKKLPGKFRIIEVSQVRKTAPPSAGAAPSAA